MRYRTKLTLLLFLLAAITNGALVMLSYFLTRDILVEEIQSKVQSIAATAACTVDGDLHSQIQTVEDQNSDSYRQIETQLRQFRDANRRNDVYIRYVYTMIPKPVSPEFPVGSAIAVDATEAESADKSPFGEAIMPLQEQVRPQILDIDAYQIDPIFNDAYGTWLSANAPIRDSQGQAVASLGVDMDVDQVLAKTTLLLRGGMIAMSTSILLAVGISVFLSRRVTRPLETLAATVHRIRDGDLNAHTDLKNKDEFGQLGKAVNDMAKALRDRELLKGTLARYLSHQVAEKVVLSGQMPELKGEQRRVTVLFLDIRNFSNMADRMSPDGVVEILNQFFEQMIEVIFRYHGTLDKFTGDGLMAIFGAPFDDEDQEYHAACAAIEMENELDKLRSKWQAQGRDQLQIGIGIHTGIAIVGNIGSTQRMDYTAIGDTVNLASRLESATKTHDVPILISEQTHAGLHNRFDSAYMDTIRVKGRTEPVPVYTIHGIRDNEEQLAAG